LRSAIFAFWLVVFTAAAGLTILLMAREGRWIENWPQMGAWQLIVRLLLCGFALLPFVLLSIAMRRSLHNPKRLIAVSAIALITVAAGIYAIYDALFVTRGDQRGLIFLFVPPLELVGAILAMAFSSAGTRHPKANNPHT